MRTALPPCTAGSSRSLAVAPFTCGAAGSLMMLSASCAAAGASGAIASSSPAAMAPSLMMRPLFFSLRGVDHELIALSTAVWAVPRIGRKTDLLLRCRLHPPVHGHPARESVEPAGAGGCLRIH